MRLLEQAVFLFLSVFRLSVAGVFEKMPSDQESIVGNSVTLPCVVNSSATCSVLWYRQDQQIYITSGKYIRQWVKEAYPRKYSVIGNVTAGDYSLRINNVTTEDSGKYQCNCGSANKRMELHVMRPPMGGYPQCTIEGGTTTLFVGDRLSLSCRSKGGDPQPTLKWYHNGVPSDNMAHTGMETVLVRYVTHAMPSHDGGVFVCIEETPALPESRNCTIGPLMILSPLDLVASLENPQPEGIAENYATMAAKDGTNGISFTCGLNPNFTSESMVQNTTWFIDGEELSAESSNFGTVERGQTLYLKDDSGLTGEVEVSCQVDIDGRSLGNITRVVEIGAPTQDEVEVVRIPDRPIIYKTDGSGTDVMDIRPLIILNACVILVMLFLILVAVCLPRVCNCRTPLYQSPKHVRRSSSRRVDSRITELHFVQSEQCQNGVARCEGPHFYETPDKDQLTKAATQAPPPPTTQMQSSQEMQATFHVVVHSRNGGPVSQSIHQGSGVTQIAPPEAPTIANVTPINSLNASHNNSTTPPCCLYAPVRKKTRGNVYTEESADQQAHYQKVTGPPRAVDHPVSDGHLGEDPGAGHVCLGPKHSGTIPHSGTMSQSGTMSPCSTLPSSSKLAPPSMTYSRTLPLTPLERKEALQDDSSCCSSDVSDDELDSLYANIASLGDICRQTSL